MSGVPKLSRRARWAVPAGALVVTGAVMAGSLITVAQAAPVLPARTPAQLLVAAAQDKGPAYHGSVLETASLGLPSLPGTGSPTSIMSLLTGSHTIKVWYAGPEHYRLALPASLSESDVVRDGSTAWLWQSTTNSVTELSVPAGQAKPKPMPAPALTPQQAASQVLAAVGPTTTVSVASNVVVAGQAAYELVLAPKDSRSLIGQIRIAVDGANGDAVAGAGLRPRRAGQPGHLGGVHLRHLRRPRARGRQLHAARRRQDHQGEPRPGPQHPGHKPNEAGMAAIGTGWLAVLELPSSGADCPGRPRARSKGTSGESAAALNALVGSATAEHGAWGTGRLLHTSLISVLMTDSGRTFVGAVQPSVLYAAAGQAARPRPATTP